MAASAACPIPARLSYRRMMPSILDLFELTRNGTHAKNLRKFGYTVFSPKYAYGADYAEVKKCDCPDMEEHNDN